VEPEAQVIEIWEVLGEHPRRPGPRLMRVGQVDPVRIEHDAMRLDRGLAEQARRYVALVAGERAIVRNRELAAAAAHAKVRARQRDRARKFAEMQLEVEAASQAAD
jgi:hypothetical protein